MRKSLNMKKRNNPFRASFFSVVAICCVVLSLVFFYISYRNERAKQEKIAREKAELVMVEWETQLQLMKEVALQIVSNYEFHPYYFKEDLSVELSMLNNFQQYKYYIALTDEYFLDYGEKWIYRSGGTTLDFELFLQGKSKDEEERRYFRKEIQALQEGMTKILGESKVLSVFDEVYILIPMKVNAGKQQKIAVLGFVVEKSALEERFRIAGNKIEGKMTLYGEDGILYSNQESLSLAEQKDVITVVSQNGRYTFYYYPKWKNSVNGNLLMLLMLLALTDFALMSLIANIFARRAYEPIQVLAERYRGKISLGENYHESDLEELKFIMDNMLQSNMEADFQIQKSRKIIRNQIMRMLLENGISNDVLSYLDSVDICLSGPFYCVISISFDEESNVSKEFLEKLQEEIEQVSEEKDEEYVYTICSFEKKMLNAICSVSTEEVRDKLVEFICDVANSYSYEPIIGIGNTYQNLNNLSASWLESMDAVISLKRRDEEEQSGFVYRAEETRRISAALESGNKEIAFERLRCFIQSLGEAPVSRLMLQYILTDFLGEVRKLSEKYQLNLSKQNVSLLISAKNVQDYEMAAKKLIHEFCDGYKEIKKLISEEETNRIYEYINEHFTEYDISIERVASDLHTSTDAVRQAVLRHTGKLYRDYLTERRIEYAKELLCQQNIPVAELGQMAGYNNVSYFIRVFRKVTGVTPAKYRKNNTNI